MYLCKYLACKTNSRFTLKDILYEHRIKYKTYYRTLNIIPTVKQTKVKSKIKFKDR